MAQVNYIEFGEGDFPQYPECPYAHNFGLSWAGGEHSPIIVCNHPVFPSYVVRTCCGCNGGDERYNCPFGKGVNGDEKR
jgi:hypothetical protein